MTLPEEEEEKEEVENVQGFEEAAEEEEADYTEVFGVEELQFDIGNVASMNAYLFL